MPPTPSSHFARFVSSVPGHLVTRYGSSEYVGARRDPKTRELSWQPEAVVALTQHELDRFSREYDRALKDGALVARTAAEYDEQIAKANAADARLAKDAAAKAAADKTTETPADAGGK